MAPDADSEAGVPAASPPTDLPAGYLEIYRLAVEMADRISARRGLANTFFLTINTGLAALLGGGGLRWYVAAAGVVLCGAWWTLLETYRRLNEAKFSVIQRLELELPARIYTDEWQLLKPAKGPGRLRAYRELGRVERIVPGIFGLIYVAELLRQAIA